MAKKQLLPEELVKRHEEEVLKSLKRTGLHPMLVVNFPGKKKPPIVGRVGAWLVNKSGGVISMKYGILKDSIAKK